MAKISSILRVLLRFCILFAVFLVGSLGREGSRLAKSRLLLRLFNFGISSAVLLSPTPTFFLDDDDDDDDNDNDNDNDVDNSNESEDDVFIASMPFSFFNSDFVVGVGLNFAGSLLFELLIISMMMVDLGVYCVA